MKPKSAKRWKLGHRVVMRNAHGQGSVEGQLIERTPYSVMIRLRDNTFLVGSTSLLEPPTGEKWPHEYDDLLKVKPGSWDLLEASCIRKGLPIPEHKPWLKDKGRKRKR